MSSFSDQNWRDNVAAIHRSLDNIERHIDRMPSKGFIVGLTAACVFMAAVLAFLLQTAWRPA